MPPYPHRPLTLAQLERAVASARCRPLKWFRPGRTVVAKDLMRRRPYEYRLEARPGRGFAPDFKPELTPAQMLAAGVFSGRYLNDCAHEFPKEWYKRALSKGKLTPEKRSPGVNLFGVRSRKPLSYWRTKGWIPLRRGDPDNRGWFQWYCRYWLGRRLPELDALQIARWRQFRRHAGQIRADYRRLRAAGRGVPRSRAQKKLHRARQRQALLQWAYDPWI